MSELTPPVEKKTHIVPELPLKEDGCIDFNTACNNAFKRNKFDVYEEGIYLYKQLDVDSPSKVSLYKSLLTLAESRSEGIVNQQPIIINAISASDIPKPPSNLNHSFNNDQS